MSNQDVRTISAATGSYPALTLPADTGDKGGKTPATTGKEVPVRGQPDMQKLAQKLNLAVQTIGRDLRFQVDLEQGRSVIQVLDRETGEIIRQIPPENAKIFMSDFGDVALRLFDAVV